jgi:LuxR family maltose regulon positive regulatory protein
MASFFLETAERMIAENPDDGENWDFVYLRFIIHSRLLAVLARFEEASEECREAMARFEAHEPGPNRSRILCAAYNNLGILSVLSVRYTRDYTFVRWFERAYRHYLEHPEPVQGQTTQGNIGSYVIPVGVAVDPGEIDVFLDAYSAAIPYISACLGGYRFGTDTLARAELAYYQGNLNKAERFARQAVYQGRQKKQCEVETRALLYLMRICIHTGGIAGIRELERQMSAQLENQEYLNRYNVYDLTMGRFYSRLGLMDRIAPWLRMEHVEGELNVLSRGFDTLVKARCLFVEKDYPAALLALEEERERGDLGSYLLGFLEMTALEAVTLYRIGDREGAYAALKKAYDAARPNGLVMPFIELGEHMAGLVNAVLKTRAEGKSATGGGEEIPRDWLLAIRSSASVYAKKRFLVLAQYAGRDGAASADFSQHELAILGGLSRGRTAEEIADDMRISVNMVKSVIRSLYAKLGAINRADAIRIATAKGLL